MSRRRNEEERERLLQVAYKLMTEQGFENTSLSDIARAANITKSLVQYYFPAKEIIATTLINRGITKIFDQLSDDSELEFPDNIVKAFAVGYVLFNYSFYNRVITKYLIQEYIENRLYTMLVVEQGIEWFEDTEPELIYKLRSIDPHFDDKLSFTFGGIIDYIYGCNENNREIDGDFIIKYAVSQLKPMLTEVTDSFDAIVNIDKLISKEWILSHVKEYNKNMFGV